MILLYRALLIIGIIILKVVTRIRSKMIIKKNVRKTKKNKMITTRYSARITKKLNRKQRRSINL